MREQLAAVRPGELGELDTRRHNFPGYWVRPLTGHDADRSTSSLAGWSINQVLSGYQREVATKDLAEVTSVHHAQMPGRAIDRGAALVVPESPWARGYLLPYQGGARVTEYVEGGGTQWGSDLSEFATVAGNPDPVLLVGLSGSRHLQAGSKSAEDWDGAVIAPRLNERSVVRWGDTLYAELPMFSDAAGHGTLGSDAYDQIGRASCRERV